MEKNSQTDKIKKTVALQRIYLKKLKFETPNSPKIFTKEKKPKSNMRLNSRVKKLAKDTYEVILLVDITNEVDGEVAFSIKLEQAGVFSIKGFPENEMEPMIDTYCLGVLFPYAREIVAGSVSKASFPQQILAPVNFDNLYAQRMQEKEKSQH